MLRLQRAPFVALLLALPSVLGTAPRVVSADQSPLVSATQTYPNAVLASKALGYYKLDDTDTTLRDSSGHRVDGHYGGSTSRTGTLTSVNDRSTVFPGGSYSTARFASAGLNRTLQPTSQVTVEAWVRQAPFGTSHGYTPIVAYGKHSQGSAYIVMLSPQNHVQFYAHTTHGGFNLIGATSITSNTVFHIVATYDGRTATIYVDGRLDGAKSASGSIMYENLNSRDGLGIGGSLDAAPLQFAGAIGQVSIYGTALSSSTVNAHYVAGLLPEVLTERPASANNFIDSIGLNVHLHYQGTTYDTQWSRLRPMLVGLGVRHIRDGLVDTKFRAYYDRLNDLGRAGVHADFVTSFGQSPSLIASYPARVAASIEAYEPPNEANLSGGPNWITLTRNFQRMLYTTVKGNRSTAKFAVFGPAVTNDSETLGDLSRYMDIGNFHLYQPGFNPGTSGYGSTSKYGTYGNLGWGVNSSRVIDGNHPIALTETGYNYANHALGNLPTDVGAKYTPRFLLQAFNTGIYRSYIYQLVDFESESYFQCGLIGQNLVPKAPYYALQSLIALLRDTSGTRAPNTIRYQLRGDLSSVKHTLLQRNDGSFDLALWIEVESITPTQHSSNGTRIYVAPQRVTVDLPATVKNVSAHTINDHGAIVSAPIQTSGSSVAVNALDQVTIVHLSF